jgi:hypothetical protein
VITQAAWSTRACWSTTRPARAPDFVALRLPLLRRVDVPQLHVEQWIAGEGWTRKRGRGRSLRSPRRRSRGPSDPQLAGQALHDLVRVRTTVRTIRTLSRLDSWRGGSGRGPCGRRTGRSRSFEECHDHTPAVAFNPVHAGKETRDGLEPNPWYLDKHLRLRGFGKPRRRSDVLTSVGPSGPRGPETRAARVLRGAAPLVQRVGCGELPLQLGRRVARVDR